MSRAQRYGERRRCPHIKVTPRIKSLVMKLRGLPNARCVGCHKENQQSKKIWCCVTCQYFGCSGDDHWHALQHFKNAMQHFKKDKHTVFISVQDPSKIYCFACEALQTLSYRSEHSSSYEASDDENESSSSEYTQSRSHGQHQNGVRRKNTRQTPTRQPLFPTPDKWPGVEELLTKIPVWSENVYGGTCGLVNLGNTCFMNASLQALLHCPPLIYLFTQPELLRIARRHRNPIVHDFIELAVVMWNGRHRVLSPRMILRDVMYLFQQFRGYGQQDAHEFLRCLLDHMHERFQYIVPIYETEHPNSRKRKLRTPEREDPKPKKRKKASRSSNNSEEKDESKSMENESQNESKSQESKKRIPKEHKVTSIISDLFCGEVISEVECLECGKKSLTKDILYDISVEIPKTDMMDRAVEERNATPLKKQGWFNTFFNYIGLTQQTVPIEMCLHTYCTSEDLVHTEKYQCDNCKKKVDAKKRLAISKLPEILMIHIKRFSHDSFWNGSSKVSTPVAFPINEFDFKEYIHVNHRERSYNKDTVYDLCSLVKHMGGTGGGHYIAYCKHPGTAHWYKFDDSRTEKTSPEKVAEQQAYILFYTRRRQNREYARHIKNLFDTYKTRNPNPSSEKQIQISRYWFHKVVGFSRPGPIDNLWLSCHHGFPLSSDHRRRNECSITVNESIWKGLVKRFGQQYTNHTVYEAPLPLENGQATQSQSQSVVNSTNTTSTTTASTTATGDETNETTDEEAQDPEIDDSPKPKKKSEDAESDEKKPTYVPWQLDVSSIDCEECGKDELDSRRMYEKEEIKKLEEEARAPADCVLSMEWAGKWKAFVYNRTDELPGALDNSKIGTSEEGQHFQLKQGLRENEDYLFISTPIWTFLHDLYGGGPKIVAVPEPVKRRRGSPPKHPSPKHPSRQAPRRSERHGRREHDESPKAHSQSQSQSESRSQSPVKPSSKRQAVPNPSSNARRGHRHEKAPPG